jgi:hypothetical protein
MNPDVVDAIGSLREEGVLSEAASGPLLRAARRDLVSVRLELKVLLYAGIVLIAAGVGLLLKENADRLGPWAVALLVAAAAAACFAHVARHAAPFSWAEAAAPHLAFDYVLLLGLALFGCDLAYLETKVDLLGSNWPYHFLAVALVAGLSAYRWDSRSALAVALTSFAAWRGVSARMPFGPLASGSTAATRANALVVGALFLVGAFLAARWKRKAHFEGVFTNLGLLLVLGGLLSGAFEAGRGARGAWTLAVLVVSGVVMVAAFRMGRPLYFAQALIAAYLALVRQLFDIVGSATTGLFLMTLSSAAVLALLVWVNRRMKERA